MKSNIQKKAKKIKHFKKKNEKKRFDKTGQKN